jgi:hypothetical protein
MMELDFCVATVIVDRGALFSQNKPLTALNTMFQSNMKSKLSLLSRFTVVSCVLVSVCRAVVLIVRSKLREAQRKDMCRPRGVTVPRCRSLSTLVVVCLTCFIFSLALSLFLSFGCTQSRV